MILCFDLFNWKHCGFIYIFKEHYLEYLFNLLFTPLETLDIMVQYCNLP